MDGRRFRVPGRGGDELLLSLDRLHRGEGSHVADELEQEFRLFELFSDFDDPRTRGALEGIHRELTGEAPRGEYSPYELSGMQWRQRVERSLVGASSSLIEGA